MNAFKILIFKGLSFGLKVTLELLPSLQIEQHDTIIKTLSK